MNVESESEDQGVAREILTISQLNRAVASLLDRSIPPLQVRGEISNFTRAASGHWYFTLKDASAQVRAVMFRGRAQTVGFVPREGDSVQVTAVAGFYQPRGEFQLNVEAMRRSGAGDLYQRFLELKEKLREQGLLDAARKRELPSVPVCVGVITSLQAAALRDVLTTLRRRAPGIPVVVYPAAVQGADAPAALIAALRAAVQRADCDVLLLVRGGGSIEDLWAFNDERLAHELAASPIPVICGVGHETDFTIADFVADHRAATPTAAAQAAVPDRAELLGRLAGLARRMVAVQRRLLLDRDQRLDTAARLLRSPSVQWSQRLQSLGSLATRLRNAARATLQVQQRRLGSVQTRLRSPDCRSRSERLDTLMTRLRRAHGVGLHQRADALDALAHKLELVSPRAVLSRGYAIVRTDSGEVVRRSDQVVSAQHLGVQLAHGELEVRVLQGKPETSGDDA